jgi:DNA-binding transcriptional LysR family regulator
MSLRKFEYAIAVAELGSVTAAAEQLHVSQPSLSQQIKALEQELDVQLFFRGPRGLVPTGAGAEFLVEARLAVDAARRARTAARAFCGQIRGALVVAVERSHALRQLPPALGAIRAAHPALRLEVVEAVDCTELRRMVRDGAADVAVGGMVGEDGLAFTSLGDEVFVVVLPEGDPLLDQDAIEMGALAKHPWVRHTGGCVEADLFAQAMGRLSGSVDTVARASEVHAAVALAAAGVGVTLVPAGAVGTEHEHLARPLWPPIARPVVAATRRPAGAGPTALVTELERRSLGVPASEAEAVVA